MAIGADSCDDYVG
ncbi:hypothetical protein F9Z40_0418 [Neisseria gonorrhoeae]|nr:hypothetical protein F9Z35_0438 [Neisseria gonorrhoeae]KAE9497109.1 hypothetical protein F9Z37_0425 [Neisseria gonorrhoeae]KAE9504744.1 hypothetical protein F9Z40_0418 [Neisseria gonorrhoeae]